MRKKIIKEIAIYTYKFMSLIFDLRNEPEFKVCKLKPHNRGMIICYDAVEDQPERIIIKISSRRGENETVKDVISTTLHELVHQYQFENSLPVEHNTLFAEMARDILVSYGIDIN